MSKAIATQGSAEVATFKPTDKMQEYLMTAIEMATDSPSKIEKNCGVTRDAWYYWLKEVPGFEDWFYSEYQRLRRKIIPKLDAITMKYAERGSYQHLELMTKKVGDLPQDKAPQVNIQQNFNNIAQKDREELGFNE